MPVLYRGRAVPKGQHAVYVVLLFIHTSIKKSNVPVTGPVVAQMVGRGLDLLFHDRDTRGG